MDNKTKEILVLLAQHPELKNRIMGILANGPQ